MNVQKFLGAVTASLLLSAVASGDTGRGQLKGRLSLDGAPTAGLAFTLVNTATGAQVIVTADRQGVFSQQVPAGTYVVAGSGSFAIGKAPLVVRVENGRVASAEVELLRSAIAEQAGVTIFHSPITCLQEDKFTVMDVSFDPLPSVANGKLYFKSNLSDEWFYIELQKLAANFEKFERTSIGEDGTQTKSSDVDYKWSADGATAEKLGTPVPPTYRSWLPKVKKDGGVETVTYYVQGTSLDFAEVKTREIVAKVVSNDAECEKGGVLGPAGNPPTALTIFSGAGAGGAVPLGMGVSAGFGIAGIAGIVAAAGAAAGAGVAISGDSPTPAPTPTVPPVTVTPTPTPTATPIAQCTMLLNVSPAGAPADPSVGGPFCRIDYSAGGVSGSTTGPATVTYPCNARFDASAYAAPQTSVAGPLPATWSGACGGSALGVTCSVTPPGLPTNAIGLSCSTR